MAGISVAVLRKTTITLPSVAASQDVVLPPLAQFIDTIGWVSGTMIVRLFSKSITGTSAAVKVILANMMVGPDDPATTFIGDGVAEITINTGSSTTPQLLLSKMPDANGIPIGRYLGLYLSAEAGSDTMSGSLTLAIDIVGRSA